MVKYQVSFKVHLAQEISNPIMKFSCDLCLVLIRLVPSISYQGYRQAPGVPFKGFHWIRCAEGLVSRFEARSVTSDLQAKYL